MLAEVTENFHDNGTLRFVLSCKCAKSVVSLCLFLRDSTVFIPPPLLPLTNVDLVVSRPSWDAHDVLKNKTKKKKPSENLTNTSD